MSQSPLSENQVLHIEVEGMISVMRRVQASQKEGTDLSQLIEYMEHRSLPADPVTAMKVVTQALKVYYLVDGI